MRSATIILAEGSEPGNTPTPAPGTPNGPGRKPGPFQGAGAAYILIAAALLGLGIGYAIDAHRGSLPTWTITCFFLFMAAGTYHMIKEGRK